MATLDKTGGNSEFPWLGRETHFIVQKEIDLAGVATGDVVQCLSIPAGAKVENVTVEVVTATGLVSTATVGDGADPDGFDVSTNLNAAAGTRTHGASVDAFIPDGKYYDTADTIDLTCTITGGPIVAGKVRVIAEVKDVSIRS